MEVADISKWIREKMPYYYYYLALSICNSVIIDNYLINGEEKEFTEKVILPNINNLYRLFGLKPLIVPIIPIQDENDIYWCCYHESIKPIVIESLNQAKEGGI